MLSPLLFNVYINELSVLLNLTYAGCCLGRSIINHLLYADDIVLFAPSAKGLQILLDVCSNFAVEHDIIFNNTKSQVMFVQVYEPFVINPCFMLSGVALSYTSQYKCLGHLLTNDLHDDRDVSKQVRSLYGRANLLLRKFRKTQVHTKVMLFKALCSPSLRLSVVVQVS